MEALGLRRRAAQPRSDTRRLRLSRRGRLDSRSVHVATGAILLPSGQPASIQVAALNVSGTTARGTLRSDPGGFTGRLDVAGGGLDGRLLFSPVGDDPADRGASGREQRALRRAAADRRSGAGRIDGVDPAQSRRHLDRRHVQRARGSAAAGSSIANVDCAGRAARRRRPGPGDASPARRGRDFAFQTVADIAPGRIRLTGSGTRRSATDRAQRAGRADARPATAGGWRRPRSPSPAAGRAVGGLFGPGATELNARMEAMPLTVLDIA